MTVTLGHCPQADLPHPRRVALVGECMIEMRGLPGALFSQTFGGDTLNAAVYLSRLGAGNGIVADYVTAIGADAFSVAMRQLWRDEGVGDQHVRVIKDALPGLYFIQTDDQGERRFAYWRGEAAARRVFDGPEADDVLRALADYDYVYLSGISLAILTASGREHLMQALGQARQ
ncbi:MAG: PfkB family carbohydrate kinase, partial [Pseudomonas bubulae]